MRPFTILPVSTGNAAVPVIASADVSYFDAYDYPAYGHWLFDRGASAGLTAKNGSKVLTPQGAAPAYSRSSLSIVNTAGNALATDVLDTASPSRTFTAVARVAAGTGTNVIIGTLQGANGFAAYFLGGGASQRVFLHHPPCASFLNIATGLSFSQYLFVAVSMDFSGATKKVRYLVGGGVSTELAVAGAYTPNGTQPVCFGTGYLASQTGTTDFAEARIYSTPKTLAELDALYADAKQRMALRGITI